MNRGKRKCELLLRMRARVAARYGLEYNPHECKHEEDCSGTCPLCDAELADLERQLQNRHITNIDQEGCDSDEEMRGLIMELLRQPVKGDGDEEVGVIQPEEGSVVREGPTEGMPYPPDIPLQGDIELPLPGIPAAPPEPERVSKFRRLFKHVYIAGLMFHDIDDVWGELYQGAKLALVPQPDNEYDKNAVAIALDGDYDPECPEDFDFEFDFILGYVPKTDNAELAMLLNMGWHEIFTAEIAEFDRNAPMSKRIGINIYIESKEKIVVQRPNGLTTIL